MKIEQHIDENHGIVEVVTISDEERAAIEEAKVIIAERYDQLGIHLTLCEKEHLVFAIKGKLRFSDIAETLKWARSVAIIKGRNRHPRGYC